MSMEHDGLEEFEDSALVRALRAPGTPEELAAEASFVAAYRRSASARGHGRVAGRIAGRVGVGGVALLAGVTLTGGMAAAAYTQRLPHPVQSIAHDAFGGVGVPPARPAPPPATAPEGRDEPDASASARATGDSPTSDATASDSARSSAGGAPAGTTPSPSGPVPPSDLPTGAPSAATGATDAASPSATAPATPGAGGGPSGGVPGDPAARPTSATVTASARRVTSGGQASVTGVVLSDGEPVPGQEVWLLRRHAGERWSRVASATTDAEGTATFATGPLEENAWFRVRVDVEDTETAGEDVAGSVLRSRPRRIGVQPVLTLSSTGPVVSARVVGAEPGDAVTISRRAADGRLVRIGIRQLDAEGHASHDLSSYSGRVRVLVRVLRTATHVAVKRWITVRVPRDPSPPPAPTPSTSPSGEPSGSAGSSTTTGS
ncbi:hypothetical protein ACJ5H2_14705 [Nocardioides sp. R1-1]|uniref:hypothetical protein n=1 Tax=Nocardioides sp. R1-1 TaxID=3383502 RepID=UPI0038D1117C